MTPYLEYRSKSLHGANDFLPNFIKRTVNFLVNSGSNHENSIQMYYTRVLCGLLVEEYYWTFTFLVYNAFKPKFESKVRVFNAHGSEHKIAAAAAVGSLPALKVASEGNLDHLWTESVAFGYPLVIAASAGHFDIVLFMIKDFEKRCSTEPLDQQWVAIRNAISVALNRRHWKTAVLLLGFHAKLLPAALESDYVNWLKEAVKSGNGSVLSAVLGVKHTGGLRLMIDGFKLACRLGRPEIAILFIDRRIFTINEPLDLFGCPLSIASDGGKVAVVRKFLDRGATPDGIAYPRYDGQHGYDRPLWRAVMFNHSAVIKLLLRRGANPKLVENQWSKNWSYYQATYPDVYAVMARAMVTKLKPAIILSNETIDNSASDSLRNLSLKTPTTTTFRQSTPESNII